MPTRRKFLAVSAAAAATLASPALVRAAPAKLRLGHVTAAGSVFDQAAHKFAELFEAKTGGAYKFDVFPGGQLGQEREVMEGMPLGIVDSYLFGTSTLTSIAPEIGDSDLPFLYESKEHASRVLESDVGDHWLKLLEPKGIKGVGWGAGGFRSCLNSKRPVAKLEDFSGLKFRIAGGPVYISMFKALGANAIQMTWGEVYTAIQQGVIDGLECPPNVMLSSKLQEVAKYLTLDEHTYSALVFGMAMPTWRKLSAAHQTAALEAGREAGRYMRDLAAKLDVDAQEDLGKAGVTVSTIDKKPLMAAMESTYKSLVKNQKIVAQIQSMR
jgi:tripartite ATP-independent transporter DctP family solute receptor